MEERRKQKEVGRKGREDGERDGERIPSQLEHI